ncbi:hypothetical protein [Rhizobium sp. 1399]|uniref:hypothetical protein n=1 Tax=Rhizobium sp. 1399 TaxID=2817758 RepID=UPI00285BC42D|nr:hypothetical protein [Rhizobium sp. 1399]MDR6666392.1 hypothetical protein [Rhizobium sp. 1399]
MKPDKLRNLLEEMDTRVGRMQRERKDHFTANLSGLRAEVQRLLSKIDSLRASDIAALEVTLSAIPINDLDRSSLNNLLLGLKIGLNQLGPDEVLDATPGQKPAAFQFGFDGDVLKVVDQPLRAYGREADIVMAALEAAVEHGEYVNKDLAATNASPRLKDAFDRLQATLISHKNIVQIGARAQICNRLVDGDLEELSPTLFALLIGHIEVCFPHWLNSKTGGSTQKTLRAGHWYSCCPPATGLARSGQRRPPPASREARCLPQPHQFPELPSPVCRIKEPVHAAALFIAALAG